MCMRAYRFPYQNKSGCVYINRNDATNIFFMFALFSLFFYVITEYEKRVRHREREMNVPDFLRFVRS